MKSFPVVFVVTSVNNLLNHYVVCILTGDNFEYLSSINEKEKFWGEVAQLVHWDKMFETVLDDSAAPFTKWFSSGYLNACYNCIDRHIADGKGSKVRLEL